MFFYKVLSTLLFILLTTAASTTTNNHQDENLLSSSVPSKNTLATQKSYAFKYLPSNEKKVENISEGPTVVAGNLHQSTSHMPSQLPKRRRSRQVVPMPCGYSNFGDEGNDVQRIINGGDVAEFLEFPWMVALLRNQNISWSQEAFLPSYLGGGSLIHPKVVLTAAHKVDGLAESTIKVRAGEYDIQSEMEIYPYQERTIKKIISHKHYHRKAVLNSIALLILETPFTPAPNVGIACLGTVLPPSGTSCFGMGWGKTGAGNDTYSTVLKKVALPLKSREDCTDALRRVRNRKYFQLHPSLTCAGGEDGKDTCGGDGGSPLVCSIRDPKDLRYAVYGMVAYGHRCGDARVPGVYVNVPEFSTWVEDQLKAEGLAADSYKF